jgi:hypothetical protein
MPPKQPPPSKMGVAFSSVLTTCPGDVSLNGPQSPAKTLRITPDAARCLRPRRLWPMALVSSGS